MVDRKSKPIFRYLLLILTTTTSIHGFQIGHLLSTCVDACQRGCTEIRNVQFDRDSNNNNTNTNKDSLKVELKDAQDPRSALTKADCAAQKVIVGALLSEWGDGLKIVSEEDDTDDKELAAALVSTTFTFEPLNRDMFEDDIGETADIDPSEITVFVDPLDGTREFVEGRLENCQVLIGIAIGGESVAGAIGIPFPDGDLSSDSTIIYGLADLGSGVIGTTLKRGPYPLDQYIDGVKYPRPHHATGDSSAGVMDACRKAAIKKFGGSNVIYGGAGNKILAAALGEVACSIQHKIGGPWDLCAPEAILKAMGGKMTDLFGEEIEIYKSDAPPRCNERGYIVSPPGSEALFHDALVAALIASDEVKEYRKELLGESNAL